MLAGSALREIERLEADKARLEGRLVDAYAALHTIEEQQFATLPRTGYGARVLLSVEQLVTHEIALATGVGLGEVSRRLTLATAPRRHRVVRAALRRGTVSLARALQIVTEAAQELAHRPDRPRHHPAHHDDHANHRHRPDRPTDPDHPGR